MSLWQEIEQSLSATLGERVQLDVPSSVGGGSINQAFRVESNRGPFFVKVNSADGLDMFTAEAEGLEELQQSGIDELHLDSEEIVAFGLEHRLDYHTAQDRVEDAARAMIRGLESDRFEITFPRRFTWLMKCLRLLPIGLYLRLTRGLVGDD